MRSIFRFASGTVLATIIACAGHAMAEEAMQFTYDSKTASIFARGGIDLGASARLEQFLDVTRPSPGTTLHLHSPGGILGEGLKLGQLIRKHQLDTQVGAQGSVTGDCFSACAIAFLGGVSRSVPAGSKYGVHRFRYVDDPTTVRSASAQVEQAQITSATLVQYLGRMGVDAELFTASALTSSNKIALLPPELLKKWRVVTEQRPSTIWSIDDSQGVIYLRGQLRQGDQSEVLALGCKDGALFLFAYFDRSKVGRELTSDALVLDSERIGIAGQRAGQQWVSDSLIVTYHLEKNIWSRLRSARSIGIMVRSAPTDYTAQLSFETGAPQREQFVRRCMPSPVQ